VRAMGIRDRPISPGSPWQNGHVGRLIGTLRRECLDRVLIFGEAHLRRILFAYAAYYNQARTHLALQKEAPLHRVVQRSGPIVSAAVMTDLPPMAKWMAAVIAGGGTASFTQGVTAILRAKSTVFTGGFGNPVIATGELGGSVLLSLLALAAPLAAFAVVILILWLALRLIRRQRRGTQRVNN
jgi:hypothetical protein